MAQHVRLDEVDEFPPIHIRPHPAVLAVAIERLTASVERNPAIAGLALALLESAAEIAEASTVRATLPEAEATIWRQVGARPEHTGALAQGRARAMAMFADVYDRSIVGDAAVAKYLKVDRSRISQRIAERSLFAVPVANERMFPRWQFVEHKIVPGLKDVLSAFQRTIHPIVLDVWMTTPDDELQLAGVSLSPIDWLRTGGSAAVVADFAVTL
jgi:hypothetical protein